MAQPPCYSTVLRGTHKHKMSEVEEGIHMQNKPLRSVLPWRLTVIIKFSPKGQILPCCTSLDYCTINRHNHVILWQVPPHLLFSNHREIQWKKGETGHSLTDWIFLQGQAIFLKIKAMFLMESFRLWACGLNDGSGATFVRRLSCTHSHTSAAQSVCSCCYSRCNNQYSRSSNMTQEVHLLLRDLHCIYDSQRECLSPHFLNCRYIL